MMNGCLCHHASHPFLTTHNSLLDPTITTILPSFFLTYDHMDYGYSHTAFPLTSKFCWCKIQSRFHLPNWASLPGFISSAPSSQCPSTPFVPNQFGVTSSRYPGLCCCRWWWRGKEERGDVVGPQSQTHGWWARGWRDATDHLVCLKALQ